MREREREGKEGDRGEGERRERSVLARLADDTRVL